MLSTYLPIHPPIHQKHTYPPPNHHNTYIPTQLAFSPETSTEQSYDYVQVFKDEDMTETWHPPGVEKFSGSSQWPGKVSR